MISTIIFSKDKPAKLHLLLETLYRNGKNLFDTTVLYECSSVDFRKGYIIAQRAFYEKHRYSHQFPIRWAEREKINLSEDLRGYLEQARPLVCLFNDENILFDNDLSYDQIYNLFYKYNPCSLSLRIGNNTVIQNPYERSDYFANIPEQGEFVLDKFLLWDATLIEPYTNFAIPFSTNGHIYNSNVLRDVLSELSVYGKEDFEPVLQKVLYNGGFSNKAPYLMACPEYSMVINNRITRLHDRDGEDLGINDVDLNQRYLMGKTIDYDGFNFKHISRPFEEFIAKFHAN